MVQSLSSCAASPPSPPSPRLHVTRQLVGVDLAVCWFAGCNHREEFRCGVAQALSLLAQISQKSLPMLRPCRVGKAMAMAFSLLKKSAASMAEIEP